MCRWLLVGLFLLGAVASAQDGGVGTPLTKEETTKWMQSLRPEALIELGLGAARELTIYTYRMMKQERVNGTLLPEDEIQVFVRENPFAVRLHFLKGPAAGRKVAYAPAIRPDELRVREAGFLSFTGAWWIEIDSALAKADTNHTVRETGLRQLMARFEKDLALAKPQGGYQFKHEGWNERGLWCSFLTAPNEGRGFGAPKTRICNDVERRLPMKVQTFSHNGDLQESYEMWNVQPYSGGADFFNPEKL